MAAKIYRGPADLPETIPVFPLTGALLLPRGRLPLNSQLTIQNFGYSVNSFANSIHSPSGASS